jgi:hypothetical protein
LWSARLTSLVAPVTWAKKISVIAAPTTSTDCVVLGLATFLGGLVGVNSAMRRLISVPQDKWSIHEHRTCE